MKALRRFATCLLVNDNLCGKLFSSSELLIVFDDSLKPTSASFSLISVNLIALQLNYCSESFFIDIILDRMKLLHTTSLQYSHSFL